MVQDSVDHPADSTGIFTYLFKAIQALAFFFGGFFFWCHFEMITAWEYLRFLVLEYMRLRNIFLKYTNGITSHNKHVRLLNL